MARRAARLLVCVVVLMFGSVRPASAGEWDILWWLEQLSGPGPFFAPFRLNVSEPLFCYGIKAPNARLAHTDTPAASAVREFFPARFTCGQAARQRVWVRFSASLSRASGDNNLKYATVLTGKDLRVTRWSYSAVADVSVRPYVDVGTSLGLVTFKGKPFDTFTRLTFEPIRVTLKPLAIGDAVDSWYLRELLQFRYTAAYIRGGLTDADFNALPGTSSSGSEFQSSFAMTINFSGPLDKWLGRDR